MLPRKTPAKIKRPIVPSALPVCLSNWIALVLKSKNIGLSILL